MLPRCKAKNALSKFSRQSAFLDPNRAASCFTAPNHASEVAVSIPVSRGKPHATFLSSSNLPGLLTELVDDKPHERFLLVRIHSQDLFPVLCGPLQGGTQEPARSAKDIWRKAWLVPFVPVKMATHKFPGARRGTNHHVQNRLNAGFIKGPSGKETWAFLEFIDDFTKPGFGIQFFAMSTLSGPQLHDFGEAQALLKDVWGLPLGPPMTKNHVHVAWLHRVQVQPHLSHQVILKIIQVQKIIEASSILTKPYKTSMIYPEPWTSWSVINDHLCWQGAWTGTIHPRSSTGNIGWSWFMVSALSRSKSAAAKRLKRMHCTLVKPFTILSCSDSSVSLVPAMTWLQTCFVMSRTRKKIHDFHPLIMCAWSNIDLGRLWSKTHPSPNKLTAATVTCLDLSPKQKCQLVPWRVPLQRIPFLRTLQSNRPALVVHRQVDVASIKKFWVCLPMVFLTRCIKAMMGTLMTSPSMDESMAWLKSQHGTWFKLESDRFLARSTSCTEFLIRTSSNRGDLFEVHMHTHGSPLLGVVLVPCLKAGRIQRIGLGILGAKLVYYELTWVHQCITILDVALVRIDAPQNILQQVSIPQAQSTVIPNYTKSWLEQWWVRPSNVELENLS